jgi:glycosyltransferase involved in cell wall biosynthesis
MIYIDFRFEIVFAHKPNVVMKKICYVATIPAVVHAFLRAHIQATAETYHVTVICSSVDKHLVEGINAHFIFRPIERKPSFFKDFLVLIQLFNIFRHERFDIVHSIMPKAGMLAMLASWFSFVPIRIHTFTGQVWITRRGVRRILLKGFDKLIGILATCTLVDSQSQQDFLINEKVLRPGKAVVIGAGSICGVDPSRFHPDAEIRQKVRCDLAVPKDAVVVLFVGRLCRDKGVLDLASAFNELAKHNEDVVLLLVGAEEDVSFGHIQEICQTVRERLRYVSFTAMPENFMAAADIFCLPSYREGFGLTIIEAAACGLPTVASRIYGITDAVADGKTGLLYPAGDVAALLRALIKLIQDNEMRQQLGNSGRERAIEQFSSERITREMVKFYDKLTAN